jgi:ribosomal protein S27E
MSGEVGRSQLDSMLCDGDGCLGDHDGLFFHSRCHSSVPTWVVYSHGVATITCAECKEPIARLLIGDCEAAS